MKNKRVYPWLICIACLLLNICATGLVASVFSTYLPFLRDELDLSNTQVSMINMVRSLVTTAAMYFTTQVYHRISLRLGTALSCVVLSISCVVFSGADSIWKCYIGAALMGITYGFGTLIPISLLIRNWFKSHVSTALAVASLGSSIATAVLPPIITRLHDRIGLSHTFLVEAAFIAVITVVIFLVIRDKPSMLGMEPYGTDVRETKEAGAGKAFLKENMSRSQVILLMLPVFLIGWSGTPYSAHLSVHFVTTGFSTAVMASALSVYGAMMAVSKMLFGITSDRFGTYRMNYFFMSAFASSSFLLGNLRTDANAMLYISMLLGGGGILMGSLGTAVWCADLSGDEEYERRVKMSQMLFSLGGLLGSLFPGIVADATGSYAPAFSVYGIIQVSILVMIQILYLSRGHVFQQRRAKNA